MKYNLSEEQWRILWTVKYTGWNNIQYFDGDDMYQVEIDKRTTFFNENIKLPLIYSEQSDETSDGYWGLIEGNEKDITFFLLQL